jgi:outer membrane protein
MKKFYFLFVCCLCIVVLPLSSFAADNSQNLPASPVSPASPTSSPVAPNSSGEWTLGAGGAVSTSPYKSYDTQWLPMPIVSYENEYVYIRGLNAGVKIINLDFLEFSAFAGYDGTSFDHSDTSNSGLKLLKNRYSSAVAGLDLRLNTPYGQFHVSGSGDLLGHSNGFTGEAGYMLSLECGPAEFIPSLGVYWGDSDYNDYYYGVSKKEAGESGFEEYSASGGFSPYVGLTLDYSLTDKWELLLHGEYVFLSSAIKDSPMVGTTHTQSFTLALTYTF